MRCQHLYCCEVLSRWAGQGQVYNADPWLQHNFECSGQQRHVNAAAHPVQVTIGAAHSAANYIRSHIVSDIRELVASLNQSTRALGVNTAGLRPDLLITGRRLMNINASQQRH